MVLKKVKFRYISLALICLFVLVIIVTFLIKIYSYNYVAVQKKEAPFIVNNGLGRNVNGSSIPLTNKLSQRLSRFEEIALRSKNIDLNGNLESYQKSCSINYDLEILFDWYIENWDDITKDKYIAIIKKLSVKYKEDLTPIRRSLELILDDDLLDQKQLSIIYDFYYEKIPEILLNEIELFHRYINKPEILYYKHNEYLGEITFLDRIKILRNQASGKKYKYIFNDIKELINDKDIQKLDDYIWGFIQREIDVETKNIYLLEIDILMHNIDMFVVVAKKAKGKRGIPARRKKEDISTE